MSFFSRMLGFRYHVERAQAVRERQLQALDEPFDNLVLRIPKQDRSRMVTAIDELCDLLHSHYAVREVWADLSEASVVIIVGSDLDERARQAIIDLELTVLNRYKSLKMQFRTRAVLPEGLGRTHILWWSHHWGRPWQAR